MSKPLPHLDELARYGKFTSTGWCAEYTENGQRRTRPVESWRSDGRALIVDAQKGVLTPADTLPGFRGLSEVSRVVAAVIAAPGWRMAADYPAGRREAGLAAWIIDQRGFMHPVPADSGGWGWLEAGEEPPGWDIIPPDSERIIPPALEPNKGE